MKILFLHPNFPAQFRHLASVLAHDPQNQVIYGTSRLDGNIPNVRKMIFKPHRKPNPGSHHYVKFLENAILNAQAVYRAASQLKSEGFYPDVICGHSGWGPTLFMKDLYPDARLICYFEWFYRAFGSDCDFDPEDMPNEDDIARIRMRNTVILTDLYTCDAGICPTFWQLDQFPKDFHKKIKVLHDGINTDYFRPIPDAKLVLPQIGLDLSEADEIITYVARGMEPYRGFPQFMEMVSILQRRKKNCHVVVVGEDRVAYSRRLPNGKSYKKLALEGLNFDLSRLHFTGLLPYPQYLKVLQASSAHVYLTRPFVLSWSMLEAMSTGCLVIGSNTPPVTEIIQDGVNGLLVNFFSPSEIADRIEEVLDNSSETAKIRTKARETILTKYALHELLKEQIDYITDNQIKNLERTMIM